MRTVVFEPEAVVIAGRLEQGASLVVSDQGVVLERAPADAERVRLPGKVLLPGLVNAHSHAFQRIIRGRTEFLAKGHERDDFWSWREAMYAAAVSLTPEQLYAVSRQTFLEMALAGVTTVGEFHYLHHQADGTPYADEQTLAMQVIRAARDVGLRIVLLRVAYARAGFEVAANPRQRRFIDVDVFTALRRTHELQRRVKDDALVSVGLAPHSVRAVGREWLEVISKEWTQGPLHMHVAEQPAEIRTSLAEHQRRPVELLSEVGLLNARFTAVHGVHLEPHEHRLLGEARATVCACPTTERNLGDGVVEADHLIDAGVNISLGSDSQAHIDLLEEARTLEGHLRLVRLRRNVLDPGKGEVDGQARRLLHALTDGGRQSLGLSPASLRPGDAADFIALDLSHPSLLGASTLQGLISGATGEAITDVYVAGRAIISGRRHLQAEAIARDFVEVVRRI